VGAGGHALRGVRPVQEERKARHARHPLPRLLPNGALRRRLLGSGHRGGLPRWRAAVCAHHVVHDLAAPRPAGGPQALHVLGGQPPGGHRRGARRRALALPRRRHGAGPLPRARQRQRQRGVHLLVLPCQAQRHPRRPLVLAPRPHHGQGGAHRRRTLPQRLSRVLPLRHAEGGHPGLEYARLLPRYLRQRVPQQLHVVEAEGGDAADDGAAHAVGGVQAAAQPNLQHHHVHPRLQKHLEPWGTGGTAGGGLGGGG
jgi:hypothetical protein